MRTSGNVLLTAAALMTVGLMTSGCRTTEHVAHKTAHVAERTVHGTGHAIHKVGSGIAHVGEKIEDHTD